MRGFGSIASVLLAAVLGCVIVDRVPFIYAARDGVETGAFRTNEAVTLVACLGEFVPSGVATVTLKNAETAEVVYERSHHMEFHREYSHVISTLKPGVYVATLSRHGRTAPPFYLAVNE